MSIVKPKAQQTQGVGNDVGSRRKFLEHQGNTNNVPAKAQHQPLDKFLGSGKRPNDLSAFAPDASFKSARGRFSGAGAPYKRPLHEHVERGSAPVNAGASRPSDDAMLRFLDRVISTAPASGVAKTPRPAAAAVARK